MTNPWQNHDKTLKNPWKIPTKSLSNPYQIFDKSLPNPCQFPIPDFLILILQSRFPNPDYPIRFVQDRLSTQPMMSGVKFLVEYLVVFSIPFWILLSWNPINQAIHLPCRARSDIRRARAHAKTAWPDAFVGKEPGFQTNINRQQPLPFWSICPARISRQAARAS